MELASSGVFCLHYPHHPLTEELIHLAQQVTA